MDSYALKISGKVEIPREVDTGHNYHVACEGSVISVTKSDNDDGSYTHTWLFKPIKTTILNPLGETIQAKDSRSKSQLFRARLFGIWKAQNIPMEFEEWYNITMDSLIYAGQDVVEMYGPKS